MKTFAFRRYLWIVLITSLLSFCAPVSGQETTGLLGKALDLVRQVENPSGPPSTDAQRIDLLNQAIEMSRIAPNHYLKGHRVLAIQAIRGAITEIRNGNRNQATVYLHTADTELSTSVSLAEAAGSPGQAPAAPGNALPTSSLAASPAEAPKPESASGYQIVHSFGDGSVPHDGVNPCTSLVQGTDGNLYGVTRSLDKDTSGNGTVEMPGKLATIYKITPQGKETVLRSFDAGHSDNDPLPEYPLTLGPDGDLYGVISGGGQNRCGIAYKITNQGVFTPLYQFGQHDIKDDPREPSAPLIRGADGDFYGTSNIGGAAGAGTVFKMTPQGVVTTLHSFLDGSVPKDGDTPWAPVALGPDGNYYGTTFNGSGVEDKPDFKGTLFQITPAGKLTILHRFADGTVPHDGKASSKAGLFMARDKTLYGTTEFGGTNNCGTFFKFTTEGAITILHVFPQTTLEKDGAFPQPTLVEGRDGNFYGTAAAGGATNHGTIYKITPEGSMMILHSFDDGTVPHDGAKPGGGLVLASDGCFYGMTREGGSAGEGTIFRIKIP